MKKTGLSLLLLVLVTAKAAPDNRAAWWQIAPQIIADINNSYGVAGHHC
ncbi:hypothetical protein [Niastella vici]|nr:hypothetical protein [Niastella vici]